MSYHLAPEVMRRLAALVGCEVVGVRRFESDIPGRPGIAYELRCPSHVAKARLLDVLAWWDARNDLELRQFLLRVVQEVGTDPVELALALHELVRDGIAFVREPRETFQDAFLTLHYGAGDCDDHTRLLLALARIAGLKARPALLYQRKQGRRVPTHVATQIELLGRWWWAETTVPAAFGEHPVDAKRRLGADGRADIGGGLC